MPQNMKFRYLQTEVTGQQFLQSAMVLRRKKNFFAAADARYVKMQAFQG